MRQPRLRKHDLRLCQVPGYCFAMEREASLIGAAMGVGKSFIGIAVADNIQAHRVLIVCPTTVRPVWRREILKHAARDYQVAILDRGSVAQRTRIADDVYYAPKSAGPAIIVVNYEACIHHPLRSWIPGRKWDLTILDESQRVMRETQTALFANDLRERSKKRMCLTGTPLTQDPLTVWAQCRFLDPSIFTDNLRYFTHLFQNKNALAARKAVQKMYAVFASRGEPPPFYVCEYHLPGTRNTEEYLKRLSKLAIRIENTGLGLPPLTIEQRTFTLSPKARTLYDAIKSGHGYELETGRWPDVRGSYAITMRLQQITSGWLADAEGEPVSVDDGKARCLEDILSEAAGEPVVVFTRFIQDMNIVRDLATKMGLAYGEISQRRKDGLSNMGTMPEGLQVVAVQEQAGGAGIDLTRARIAVDYSPSWRLDMWDQKVARVYRPPQDKPVILYQLVAENTIDEEIHRALTARRGMVKQVWRGL